MKKHQKYETPKVVIIIPKITFYPKFPDIFQLIELQLQKLQYPHLKQIHFQS